jgi:hypothetical protein
VAGSAIATVGYRYLVRFVVLVGMQVPVLAPPWAMLSSLRVSVRMLCRRSDRVFWERFIDVSCVWKPASTLGARFIGRSIDRVEQ